MSKNILGPLHLIPKGIREYLKSKSFMSKAIMGLGMHIILASYRLLANMIYIYFLNAAIPVDNGYLTAHFHYFNS